MQEIKYVVVLIVCLSCSSLLFAQDQLLKGTVVANSDVENIHVINQTWSRFSVTSKLGQFEVPARVGDTIQFTGVKYQTSIHVVTRADLESRVTILMVEKVNSLDEVVVGKVLTGALDSDIKNSDAKTDINFYDVGIPGYKGKPKTQNERRLYEADHGRYVAIGLGVAVNVHKILNGISGRTKRLKERVRLETNDALLVRLKDRLSKDFFETHPLDQTLHNDFFFFCSEDPQFRARCENTSDLEIVIYLQEKYKQYMANIKSNED